MVYESDFYTTRRSYGRPSYSTYSVSYEPAHLYPGYGKGKTYHHIIPHAGHMRLTAVSAPTFTVRTRPSTILAEMDRINSRVRPSLAYQPAEDFLNSRSIVSFDDEARAIRGQAAHLLKRIHTPVPRALRPLPVITTGYEYEELPLPPRITSDMYIQRLLGLRDVQHEVLSRSYYNDPGSRANIGKGHLACVSYAGGKAFSRRRPLASHENNGDYIRNNVKMLSHYERMREAAKSPVVEETVFPGELRPSFIVRGPRVVNSGYHRPTNDPGKEYAEALASAAIATANFNMHTAALEENRRNKQKKEDARLASEAKERENEGSSDIAGDQEPQSEPGKKESSGVQQQVQKKLEEEVKRKAEEEAKKKAEEEAKKKAEEEAKNKAEAEAKKKAEEEAEKKAKEEAKKKAEEEAKKKAEEEEAKRKAEEEARKKAEEEAKRKAEEEEAKIKAEEEAKRKAEEEEAKKKAEEEEARRKAEEEEAKRKEEARIKAEEEEARRKLEEEEAKKKAEEEAAQESEPAKEEEIDDIWAGVDEDMPRKKVVPEDPVDTAEEEAQPTGDQTDSKPAEEEQADQGPEPVVEEPTSPETPAPSDHPEIEEVPASEEE